MEETNTNFGHQMTPPLVNNNEPVKTPIIFKRPIAPINFGLIVLMFFFTFIDIKCNGVTLGTVKGYELATGYSLDKSGEGGKHHEKPNYFAAGALFFALLGTGLAFIKAKPGSILRIICGAAGFMNMLVLFASLKYDAHQTNKGGSDTPLMSSIKISVDFELAFWIAMLLFLLAAVLAVIDLTRKKA